MTIIKETIKAAEPLVIAVLAVVFGLGALAMGYDGVVVLSVFTLLGGIVGYKIGKTKDVP